MLIVIVVLMASAQVAIAYQVQVGSSFGPYQTGSGGEFTFFTKNGTFNGGFDVSANYSTKTQDFISAESFQTFCLEYNEFIYKNTTYDAVFNTAAVFNGIPGNSDPISIGTAWLYSNFARGTLAGYDYNNLSSRFNSAAALQNTIWWLEGEAVDPGSGNIFRQAVLSQFHNNTDEAMANANGAYGVMVLNLYAAGHANEFDYKKQDMLVVTPIPAAAWLLSTGLIGLVGIRRRFYKN
jgi:hypothetical protein